MKQDQKFETIITSYINGNISWVKEQVKKLSKADRKQLYAEAKNVFFPGIEVKDDADFFFNLI